MWPERTIEADARHECPELPRHRGAAWGRREDATPEARYGPAITAVEKFGDAWWGHNGEYSTEISYCPWCGRSLE